ncbi:unnamed protein product [Parajaminaea phylloscopi]
MTVSRSRVPAWLVKSIDRPLLAGLPARRTLATTTARRNHQHGGSGIDAESYPPPNSSMRTKANGAGSSQYPPPFASAPSAVSTFGAPADLLSYYSSLPPTGLSLRALLRLNPASTSTPTQARVHQSALFTARELPIRLARLVAAFRSLPFIVGANPHIGSVARLYAESFEMLAQWRQRLEAGGQGDEERFVESLRSLVESHRENVPILARGFLECRQYMSAAAVSAFLDRAIHARIGIRLIAEQHLSLASGYFKRLEDGHEADAAVHASSSSSSHSPSAVPSAGTIHTDLSPFEVLKHVDRVVSDLCHSTLGAAPELVIEGHRDATYVGVPVHLEYVLTELLKNSYRASVERSEKVGEVDVRPVKVTIAKSKRHISMRIRDRGGGIHPKDLNRVFSYAFTTAGREPGSSETGEGEDAGPYSAQSAAGLGGRDASIDGLTSISAAGLQSGLGTLAGLGYGLPMARIYATYFGQGAELGVVSLWGEGCDTFLKLSANPLG